MQKIEVQVEACSSFSRTETYFREFLFHKMKMQVVLAACLIGIITATKIIDEPQTRFIDQLDAEGRTPLIVSVLHDNIDTTVMLLKYGADCDVIDIYGKSAVDYAMEKNTPHISHILDVYGCNDDSGISMFDAIRYCDGYLFNKLMDLPFVSPDTIDKNGCSLLAWAIAIGCDDAVYILAHHGVNMSKMIPTRCIDNIF